MNKSTRLKALAIYQIAGGVIGLLITGLLLSKLDIIPGLLGILLFVAIALYLFSIYCGILLLKKDSAALNYSLVNQCLQLVSFSVAGFSFLYISGAYFSIGFSLANSFFLLLNFGVSSWNVTITTDGSGGPTSVMINLIALFLIIFILRLKKEKNTNDAEEQIASLGQQ